MSKDSSIKVFAENASGTRPANAIPVWIDNISAIGGGGGGGNPEVESYVTTNSGKIDDVCSAVITNSASWSGTPNDTFYIYPGTTTDKEISENSGKDMKLYNSANNVYLDYAGKTTYSNYSLLTFKGVTGQGNPNTVQTLRLRVYPAATSACKVYDTSNASLLNSDSTVNYAYTAYCDINGNDLTQTYSNLTALNDFVQTNSANWEGGGGNTGTFIPLEFNFEESYMYGSKGNSYTLSSSGVTFVFTAYDNGYHPNELNIDGNYYMWSYNNGRWEIQHQISGQETVTLDGSNIGIQYNGQDVIGLIPIQNINVALNKVSVSDSYGNTTGYVDLRIPGYGSMTYTSFNGSWTGEIPSSYNGNTVTSYSISVSPEYYESDYSYYIRAYAEAEPTINSADVFPPTNNLDKYTTYYLGWNANNGGLQWFSQGGN